MAHPIERLRFVARSSGAPSAVLVQETAGALRAFGADPQGLVTACRRIVARQPASGPLWYLAARALTSADGVAEAQRVAAEVGDDRTPRELARALPDDALVVVVGWPEHTSGALRRRGDLRVDVVEAGGPGTALVGWLGDVDLDAVVVEDRFLAAAVAAADLVLVETTAAGPERALVPPGSHAAAAVGRAAGVPVWLVGGVGRWLPDRLHDVMAERALTLEPGDDEVESLPLGLVDRVVGPTGLITVADAVAGIDCPPAPELLRTL